ncbi:unnamed protein product [Lactuca saligna]|uniref:Uncharacterized protein n=1 Tax=Lactuca saligna TaxID=75948 RepID=A0AA36ECT4_LACSI|nr:unnamed protein product [Lactuca saligna]
MSLMTGFLRGQNSILLGYSFLLLVFNKIGDAKDLGRCCVVSKRFHTLVLQVENVVVRVDCVVSDDDAPSASGASDKSRGTFSSLVHLVFGGIVKPIQALGNLLGPKRSSSSLYVGNNVDADDDLEHGGGVTHHSPTQVLKKFDEIRFLKIEL